MKNASTIKDSDHLGSEDAPVMLDSSSRSPRRAAPPLEPEYLTRKEVASRLGVTVHEVRRRENVGTLKPSARDQRGWVLYSEADIANVPRTPPRKTHGTSYTVEEAARVYALLKDGKALVDIVMEAAVHPDAVLVIADSYARLTGAMLVPANVMAQVNELPLDGEFPLTTADALLDCMRNAVEEAKCRECKKKPRTHCVGCGAQVARRRVEG